MLGEEVQGLLARFGFPVSLNKKIGTTGFTHMIHSGTIPGEIVEYTIKDSDMVENVWLFRDGVFGQASTTVELEIWLDK